jgi:hypothetical protein
MTMAGGRPTKLTAEIQATICEVIQSGCYLETAAAFVGLDRGTIYRWLKKGARSRRGPYRAFADAVRRAMAQAEIRDLLHIRKAGEFHWQAAAWRLERRYPKRWGRRSRDQIESAAAQPSPEETAARIRQFLAAADALEEGVPTTTSAPSSTDHGEGS